MATSKRFPPWLIAMSVTQGGALLVFMNFAGALPLLQQDWGLTNFQAGAIQSAGQVGYLLAVLVMSSLSDYVDSKQLIVGGALWAGISNLIFSGYAHNFSSAIIIRIFVGFGIAGIYMPGLKLITQKISPKERGRAVGFFVAAFTLGAALSIALGGNLSSLLGWRNAFGVMSIGPFLGAVISFRMLPRSGKKEKDSKQPRQLKELLSNQEALLVIGLYIVHAWEVLGLRGWLAAYLSTARMNAGMGLAEATSLGSLVAGIATIAGAVGTASIGALSDRFSRVKVIKIVMMLGFVFIIILGFSFVLSWILLVLVSVIAVFLSNADSAVISTRLTEVVPEEYLGRTLAIYSFLGFTAGSISPIVFGAVLDRANHSSAQLSGLSWQLAFATLALASLIGIIIAMKLERRSRQIEQAVIA